MVSPPLARTSMPSSVTKSGSTGAGRLSSSARAATLAASTSGWSNGSMPNRMPATAIAYSQTSIWPPRLPEISISPVRTWRVSDSSATSRTI